ncbi:MAG: hypothetical protein U0694_28620 [Anaerolineae bacterium]
MRTVRQTLLRWFVVLLIVIAVLAFSYWLLAPALVPDAYLR